jgi:hypothetical protein
MGALSRNKGAAFERQIAADMRLIYDPKSLLDEVEEAKRLKDRKAQRRLLKQSNVRRSEQTKGAREPDLVIRGCPCWQELQCANRANFDPVAKFKQAERDISESNSSLWPVAICKMTGSHSIIVRTPIWVVLALEGWLFPDEEVLFSLIVTIAYPDYLALLRKYHEVGS